MTSSKPSWRGVLSILGCSIVLFVAAYWSTTTSLAEQWFTSTYSHGILVFPIALYLGWRRRHKLASLTPESSFWTLIWIGVFAFAWLLGMLTNTAVVQHFCLVAMLVTLIWGEIGTPAARVLAMPLLFLFFAVPIGDALIPWLQDFSAWFAVRLLDLTRVPVLLEGRILTIPSGKWEVAEACSGIRYLLASLTIGFVYADIMYRNWIRRIAFVAASAVVPVLANGLRIYGIILTDYLGGTRLARSADHILAGWVFLSMITVCLMALGMRWREGPSSEPLKTSGLTAEASASEKTTPSMSRFVFYAILALLVAGTGPLTAITLSRHPQDVGSASPPALLVSLPWSPTGRDLFGWRPAILAPDAELMQTYQWQDRVVKLYVAYYAPGGTDAKLVSSAKKLFDPVRWQRTGEGSFKAILDGKSVRLHQTAVRSVEASLLLWNWYWADGEFTANEYEAKWLLAKSRLAGRGLGSAVIVIATDERPGDSSAAEILGNFLGHLSLSESLRGPRQLNPSGSYRSRRLIPAPAV